MKPSLKRWLFITLLAISSSNVFAVGEIVYESPGGQDSKSNKVMVMKVLDEMRVPFSVDKQGDLVYRLNDKGWMGYVIFHQLGSDILWNVQVRVQFATKPAYYDQLLTYANRWNIRNLNPKIALKSAEQMVLSINYPVQYGFNAKEFEINVFNLLNRMAIKVAKETREMRK